MKLRKKYILSGIMAAVCVMSMGCYSGYNKGWKDLTPEEKKEVKEIIREADEDCA